MLSGGCIQLHNHYHHQIEEDVHGYVRKFCEKLSKLWLCKWWKVPTGCPVKADIVEGDDY